MIATVDYDSGNPRSVVNAVSKLVYRQRVTSSPKDMLNAQND